MEPTKRLEHDLGESDEAAHASPSGTDGSCVVVPLYDPDGAPLPAKRRGRPPGRKDSVPRVRRVPERAEPESDMQLRAAPADRTLAAEPKPAARAVPLPEPDVGCFAIRELSPGRWKVVNTLNGFEHVTYGTREEVEEQAQLQTKAWERKLSPQLRGAAWRSTMQKLP